MEIDTALVALVLYDGGRLRLAKLACSAVPYDAKRYDTLLYTMEIVTMLALTVLVARNIVQ